RYLEARARARTSDEMRALAALGAKTAHVRRPGGIEEDVPVERLAVGDVVIVRPAETIASDGLVLAGSSAVDESMVTGESIPVEKGPGDPVTGGTRNATGSFRFRVTKVGEDTLLAQIVRMVEEAQGSKAPIQRLVDRIAAVFVPLVIALAIGSGAIWLVFGPQPSLGFALSAFVAVLIIACPCALGLATPTAIIVGTGRGAARGILIKSAEALEAARHLDVVAFAKTGTLTVGRPQLVHYLCCAQIDGAPGATIAAADVPRAAPRDAIAECRRMGLRTLLVSGDAPRAAKAVARALGIDDVRAGVRPNAKAELVAELQRGGRRVA